MGQLYWVKGSSQTNNRNMCQVQRSVISRHKTLALSCEQVYWTVSVMLFLFVCCYVDNSFNKIYFRWPLCCQCFLNISSQAAHMLLCSKDVRTRDQQGATEFFVEALGGRAALPKEDRRSDAWTGGSGLSVNKNLNCLQLTFARQQHTDTEVRGISKDVFIIICRPPPKIR